MSSDSKSDDDYALNIDLDEECENLQDAYDRLYQLSEELIKTNYKLNKKMNILVKKNLRLIKSYLKLFIKSMFWTKNLLYVRKKKKILLVSLKL